MPSYLHALVLLATLTYAAAQVPSLEDMRAAALQLPDSAPAQSNYGAALKSAGRLPEAMERFDEALRL